MWHQKLCAWISKLRLFGNRGMTSCHQGCFCRLQYIMGTAVTLYGCHDVLNTSNSIVCSAGWSGEHEGKHQSYTLLALYMWPVVSLHKWSLMHKEFPYHDAIMDCYEGPWFGLLVVRREGDLDFANTMSVIWAHPSNTGIIAAMFVTTPGVWYPPTLDILLQAHPSFRAPKHYDVITEILFASLALCEGNPPLTGEFPHKALVIGNVDVFCDVSLNKPLNKQSKDKLIEIFWHSFEATVMTRQCIGHRVAIANTMHCRS